MFSLSRILRPSDRSESSCFSYMDPRNVLISVAHFVSQEIRDLPRVYGREGGMGTFARSVNVLFDRGTVREIFNAAQKRIRNPQVDIEDGREVIGNAAKDAAQCLLVTTGMSMSGYFERWYTRLIFGTFSAAGIGVAWKLSREIKRNFDSLSFLNEWNGDRAIEKWILSCGSSFSSYPMLGEGITAVLLFSTAGLAIFNFLGWNNKYSQLMLKDRGLDILKSTGLVLCTSTLGPLSTIGGVTLLRGISYLGGELFKDVCYIVDSRAHALKNRHLQIEEGAFKITQGAHEPWFIRTLTCPIPLSEQRYVVRQSSSLMRLSATLQRNSVADFLKYSELTTLMATCRELRAIHMQPSIRNRAQLVSLTNILAREQIILAPHVETRATTTLCQNYLHVLRLFSSLGFEGHKIVAKLPGGILGMEGHFEFVKIGMNIGGVRIIPPDEFYIALIEAGNAAGLESFVKDGQTASKCLNLAIESSLEINLSCIHVILKKLAHLDYNLFKRALDKDKYGIIREILKKGIVDRNTFSACFDQVLLLAVQNKDLVYCREHISKGKKLNVIAPSSFIPALKMAARDGNVAFLRIFLEAEIVGHAYFWGEILLVAAKNGRKDFIQDVLKVFPLNSANDRDILEGAAEGGHIEIIKEYLPRCMSDPFYPLLAAVRKGHLEIVRFLRNMRNFQRTDFLSALKVAAEHGHADTFIDLLIADLTAQELSQFLLIANQKGQNEFVKTVREHPLCQKLLGREEGVFF